VSTFWGVDKAKMKHMAAVSSVSTHAPTNLISVACVWGDIGWHRHMHSHCTLLPDGPLAMGADISPSAVPTGWAAGLCGAWGGTALI